MKIGLQEAAASGLHRFGSRKSAMYGELEMLAGRRVARPGKASTKLRWIKSVAPF